MFFKKKPIQESLNEIPKVEAALPKRPWTYEDEIQLHKEIQTYKEECLQRHSSLFMEYPPIIREKVLAILAQKISEELAAAVLANKRPTHYNPKLDDLISRYLENNPYDNVFFEDSGMLDYDIEDLFETLTQADISQTEKEMLTRK